MGIRFRAIFMYGVRVPALIRSTKRGCDCNKIQLTPFCPNCGAKQVVLVVESIEDILHREGLSEGLSKLDVVHSSSQQYCIVGRIVAEAECDNPYIATAPAPETLTRGVGTLLQNRFKQIPQFYLVQYVAY